VPNAGSSTITYRLDTTDRVLGAGIVERVGEDGARMLTCSRSDTASCTAAPGSPSPPGRRVLAELEALVPLAPLHNPAATRGIEVARTRYPDVAQVAVVDTAFHQTLPTRARRYALPRGLADRYRIRRYGFHGISHGYVARRAAEHLGRPATQLRLVTPHLGNGASAAAIAEGRSIDTSIDTSMGLAPLPELVMGTRGGNVDPASCSTCTARRARTSPPSRTC
jgi:acetate kinase